MCIMKFIASLPFYNFHVLHMKLFLCVRSEGTLSVLWQIKVRQQEKKSTIPSTSGVYYFNKFKFVHVQLQVHFSL